MKKLIPLLLFSLVTATAASAHSVWVNSFESHAHQPPHTMVSIGWGHALPMDDILTSPNGRIAIDRFEVTGPDMKTTPLRVPEFKLATPDIETRDFDLFSADLGLQKLALKKESTPGVYQVSAVSRPSFITKYIDKGGKQRVKLKSKDQLDDIDKILMCIKYQAFAKSCVTVGNWQEPAPLGHGLEIIPRTDLSNVRAGDLVEVEVLFYGNPLSANAKTMDFITAHSAGFGQNDGFFLGAYIINGRAKVRVQSAGQWVIGVNHKEDVTQDGPLKDLYGKVEQVYHGASLTFTVN